MRWALGVRGTRANPDPLWWADPRAACLRRGTGAVNAAQRPGEITLGPPSGRGVPGSAGESFLGVWHTRSEAFLMKPVRTLLTASSEVWSTLR